MTNKFCIFVFTLFCALTFTSCSSDSDPEPDEGVTIEQIVGEWIYDHPEQGLWERLKFIPSGVFYYSNTSLGGWKFSNDTKDGRYFIEGKDRITMNVVLGNITTKLMLTIKDIKEYEFTAEFKDANASVGIFTYAKQLGSINIKPGESATPDYSKVVNATIKGFSSHNKNVVEVDANSGKITAVTPGQTYIDIETDKGTAVYEIIVFDPDNMFDDYTFAFGKTVQEIVDLKGDNYLYKDDDKGLIYYSNDFLTDTIKYYTGLYDTKHIEFVQLCLNDNVSKSNVKKYLDGKYDLLSSEEDTYSYVTDKNIDGSPVAAIYNTNQSTLSFFVILPESRWMDFSNLFGMSKEIVANEMSEFEFPFLFSDYSYSKDGSDYYEMTGSPDAFMVGFVFNYEKKMCEYWVYLNENFMSNVADILKWLKAKYVLNTEESTKSEYVFYDKTNRLRVVFNASGYVSYTDKQQLPFTPASQSSPSVAKIKALRNSINN
ncbi:MAG: hypothetical protein ACI4BH_11250 [Muribaculaceae bacterium]